MSQETQEAVGYQKSAEAAGSNSEPEPRWPGLVALAAGGCLHMALPSRLSYGPDWALFALMIVLMVPILAAHLVSNRQRAYVLARWLTFIATGALTLALMASIFLLIQGIPHHKDDPAALLRAASVLWITNVLVFALWYWKLDAGGPLGRDQAVGPIRSAFLFPQMCKQPPDSDWSPQFLDYLFVAFNTSTAFSPTDTPILDRWAKVLSMIQALLSLTILAVLAARAINVL
jgi:uncharacterized membrane protein